MARKCELTGKKVTTGNNISHSHRKTRRKWYPNLQQVTIIDENGKKKKMKVTAKAMRTLAKKGM